jgi:hypothetical protein
MHRRLLLGIAAAVAVLVVAFGGAGSVVRADGGGSISGTVYFDTDVDGQRAAREPLVPWRLPLAGIVGLAFAARPRRRCTS